MTIPSKFGSNWLTSFREEDIYDLFLKYVLFQSTIIGKKFKVDVKIRNVCQKLTMDAK